MQDVYLLGACRTAIGSFGGSLKDKSAPELGAVVLREALSRAAIKADMVDEVYFGNVLQAGLGQNVARQVSVKAGIPVGTSAATVNMVCGSGMKTVLDGLRAIRCGDASIVAAGGCENMSAAPYTVPSARWGARMMDTQMVDIMVKDGLWDVFNNYHMGITAENICSQWNLSREELDAFALKSQKKAAAALETGRFKDEIVPVEIKVKKEKVSFVKDEYPRAATAEALAKLRPAFMPEDGKVTAGNASGINDGAAAMILANQEAVLKYGLKPMAKITGWGQAGVDPSIMGVGPVGAVEKALEKAGLYIADIDLIEANEAFAAQSLAVAKDLDLNMGRVNVNGGAIALGHPIGASGARIIVTLLHEMQKRSDVKNGLATLCIGGGMGIAMVFEKV